MDFPKARILFLTYRIDSLNNLSDFEHLTTVVLSTKTKLCGGEVFFKLVVVPVPAPKKSLCNACGIRSRKKRRALLGLNKEDKKSKKSSNKSIVNHHHHHQNQSSNSSSSGESTTSNAVMKNACIPFKKRLQHFGREVGLQRPRSSSATHRRKLGDEEQAAFLLMALSCGSVYA